MPKTSPNPLEDDAQSVPSSLRIVCDDSTSIALQAAESPEEGKPALRKFSMTAYTGGAMRLGGWPYPVVVDLAGMRVTRKSRPILKDHDRGSIVGHTSDIKVSPQSLEVAGVISGVGATAQEVIATSENGFPWQASLGASADKVVFIPEGKAAQANGREFKGPVYVARKSTLGEVSFVALGADDNTEARVAAGQADADEQGAEPEEQETNASDMRGTNGANTVAPLSAAGVRSAVGLASANLDSQLGSKVTNTQLQAALPANFAALGISASGHVGRVTLVDTTTTNADMRGTDGANTVSPLSAAGVRAAIGLATANLDTQLNSLLTEADLLTALPTNFAALGINASGHISRVTLVDTTTTNSDMRGTDGANTVVPLSASGVRAAVGLASADLDSQLGALLSEADLLAALPTNFAALGINASGHISRVTLVDTTTSNTDMRGTEGANTVIPLSASEVRTAIGLASGNLDSQLAGLLNEADLLAALPSNFAALGINATGHISRVTLVDTTTANSDMRGTDGANTQTPPSAAVIRDAVLDTVLAHDHNVLGSLSDFIQTTSLAVDDVIKSGEERTLTRAGKDPVSFTETRVLR
ncbi:hypothetical protein SH139x_002171 [Planctomycetaceae bacterium SH139]